jgi:hypothetical protein
VCSIMKAVFYITCQLFHWRALFEKMCVQFYLTTMNLPELK